MLHALLLAFTALCWRMHKELLWNELQLWRRWRPASGYWPGFCVREFNSIEGEAMNNKWKGKCNLATVTSTVYCFNSYSRGSYCPHRNVTYQWLLISAKLIRGFSVPLKKTLALPDIFLRRYVCPFALIILMTAMASDYWIRFSKFL